MKTLKVKTVIGAALLLGICPGCFVAVEEPKPKSGVDVKIDREPSKGLDIDVDVDAPAKP